MSVQSAYIKELVFLWKINIAQNKSSISILLVGVTCLSEDRDSAPLGWGGGAEAVVRWPAQTKAQRSAH